MRTHQCLAAKLAAASMAIAMLFSCEKVYLGEEDNNSSKTITFNLMAPATTRATSVADFQTVLVLDIMDGKVQQLIRQVRGASDFGTPTITLSPGAYAALYGDGLRERTHHRLG